MNIIDNGNQRMKLTNLKIDASNYIRYYAHIQTGCRITYTFKSGNKYNAVVTAKPNLVPYLYRLEIKRIDIEDPYDLYIDYMDLAVGVIDYVIINPIPVQRLSVGHQYLSGTQFSDSDMRFEFKNYKLKKEDSKMSLTNIFKQLFLTEPTKSFTKAGIINDDGYLTNEGCNVFLKWLLDKNADSFKTEVVDPIIKEMEKE